MSFPTTSASVDLETTKAKTNENNAKTTVHWSHIDPISNNKVNAFSSMYHQHLIL
jgi:hypothetical protein